MNEFLKEFKDRGFFYQCTDEFRLSEKLSKELPYTKILLDSNAVINFSVY